MNSDYIPRLRQELLRAGARQPARRRPRVGTALRPVAFAAAVAALAAALVLALPDGPGEEQPATTGETVLLSYRLDPTGAATAREAAAVMRTRLVAADIDGAQVTVVSDARLTITAPASARADVDALTAPGRVAFYDWERSVLGPDGRPAPGDPGVTGGEDAGHSPALSKDEADALAAQAPGSRAVRAFRSDGWFVLGGAPALTEADIASVSVAAEELPTVAVEFNPRGQEAFTELTREVARRGSPEPENWQHFAIVVDDRIVSVPYIHPVIVPDGIDGSEGAYITGDLTPQDVRRMAAILTGGPLPVALAPM
jgi:preprotein translocase subunit SecD